MVEIDGKKVNGLTALQANKLQDLLSQYDIDTVVYRTMPHWTVEYNATLLADAIVRAFLLGVDIQCGL